jgi:hypothetical protein
MRRATGAEGPFRVPLAGAEEDPELAAYLDPLPQELRRTVLAAGLEPALARLLRDRRAAAEPPSLEWIARRQAVAIHLGSLKVQVDAVTFELDCAGDLIEIVQSSIERDDSQREIRRTLASLIVGATAVIAAGIWELSEDAGHPRGPLAVEIAGGAAAAGLGVAAFVRRPEAIYLEHGRNLLAPIISGEDPAHLFPTFVFRLLTLPRRDGSTRRDALLERFEQILRHAVDEPDLPRAEALVYGEGGVYDVALLDAREEMMDELESAVSAILRDLELVERYLGRTLDGEWLAP